MKTATVRQSIASIAAEVKLTTAFHLAIEDASVDGGHEALRMKLTMAALPLDAHFRLLCAIEASERAHRIATVA